MNLLRLPDLHLWECASELFFFLLHILLGLNTTKTYILTHFFRQGTEAEFAIFEIVTQNQP